MARFADGCSDGALSPDAQLLGSDVHGLFDAPCALAALLPWAGVTEMETAHLAAPQGGHRAETPLAPPGPDRL